MPKVKGIYENGVIRLLEKIDISEKEEVEIIYGEGAREEPEKGSKIPTFKASELQPLIGIIAVGGDAVKDAERYDE